MKRIIKLYEDYGAWPLWVYDENGVLEDNDVPEEWENETELIHDLDELQNQLEATFIDDEYGFRCVGFKDDEARKKYYNSLNKVRRKIKALLPTEWEFIDETLNTRPLD